MIEVLTKPGHGNTGIIDHEIDSLRMLLLEKVGKRADTVRLRDVQLVIRDVCQSAILSQGRRFLQLIVMLEILQCLFSFFFIPRRQINQEGAIVERRFRVLERKVSDWLM